MTADPLTMVTWQEFSSGDFRTQLVTFPLDEPDRTVKQILGDGVEGSEAGVTHHEKSPHFKMHRHGPQSSLRKVIFVGPTIMRSGKRGL